MLIKLTNKEIIYQLDCQCFREPYSWETYLHADNAYHYYGIFNNEQVIVGFITLLAVGDDYELIKIGILSAYQRQGWAFRSLQELLATLDFENMFLEVNEHNQAAINLYLKLHFEIIHTRKQYYHDDNAYILKYHKGIHKR